MAVTGAQDLILNGVYEYVWVYVVSTDPHAYIDGGFEVSIGKGYEALYHRAATNNATLGELVAQWYHGQRLEIRGNLHLPTFLEHVVMVGQMDAYISMCFADTLVLHVVATGLHHVEPFTE